MVLCLTQEQLHGFSSKLERCWISGYGTELQSLGGKTLAVVEISTDNSFGDDPHLNAKKKSSFVIAIAEETIRGHQS